MKHLNISILLVLFCYVAIADNVTIIITQIPENTPPGDNIYFAGNLNGWDPGDPGFMLEENSNGHPEIIIEGSGSIEFKFTRGSWDTVEGNENGGFLPNRTFNFGSTDTLELTILSWEDQGGTNHTAAENVTVMDEDFYMPQFDRYRRIWLYLPPNYDSVEDHFPVLYMHDGQNLFDAATSFAGEWEVDETLNQMYEEGKIVPIVVGIDNGGVDRIDEYTPWPNQQYGGGDGDLYAQFIVETLKPYIDENYRTITDRVQTGVMGSSLGGLISHYIAIKYQDVFGLSGIFSPSYWFNDSIYDFTYATGKQHEMRLYIMGGTAESPTLVQEMEMMVDTLDAIGIGGDDYVKLKAVPGGQHNEQLWREEFGEAYEWLFLESPNNISKHTVKKPQLLFYQDGKLVFRPSGEMNDQELYSMQIFSITGQQILSAKIRALDAIELPSGLSGICVARISSKAFVGSQKILISGK